MLQISACAWALRTTPIQSLDRVRLAGFDTVDLRPDCWDGIEGEADISGRGLKLGCFGLLGGPLTGELSIDDITGDRAQPVVDYLCDVIDRAGTLGADRAYMITPSSYPDDDAQYLASIRSLADHASAAGLKLCLEPTPGRSLNDDAACLEFVRKTEHENVHVLVDFGHCLITGEVPSESIRNAGDRLGYVHLDDNHGVTDDHVALFDGVLKAPVIEDFLDTLVSLPYNGGVGIEFKITTPSPMSALVQARDFIRDWESRRGVPV
ncbi:MAG: sugar phosphate isomerase/epimerase [Chloroflexi bacterium]|nr:sugar phosphate isomerase/epimerase [Chloroflexota bacterium]MCH8235416.1 sugar phosphate isomerase/epimerase [Chloroflexota bacterium]MCH8816675.1 sugar phosphate isomerase/epimerase [Chloroflexota bacterium]